MTVIADAALAQTPVPYTTSSLAAVLVGVIVTLIAFLLKRSLDAIDERGKDHELRIRALEKHDKS